ncbi:MAG: glycosyltransferase family 4 protein [Planctomycetota bacterium]
MVLVGCTSWCQRWTCRCVIHAPCPVREPRAGDALARKTGRRLLFVGVDAERKGLGEVLAAIPGVRRRFPHITLDVVSRPRAALRRALSRLPYVRWHASARAVDVGQLMAAADVLLMPTQADTYGLAAVEAMAHGCAIVTSDLPPLPELFPDQLVGCTVPVRDARELERQVSGLLAQPERLRVLQRNARQRYLERHAPAVVERALLAACAEATMRFQQRREGSDHEHRPSVA